MNAAAAIVKHAKQRAEERYNAHLNRHEYYALVGKIMRGESTCIKRVSNSRTVHIVDDKVVVYSSAHHKIITFLPRDCREANAPTN